jgi:hypothetical protein
MGEDGILYNIVVYKTDKNLDEWVKEKNNTLPGTKITQENIKIKNINGLKQIIDETASSVASEGIITEIIYLKTTNKIIEIYNDTKSNATDWLFEKTLNFFSLI